MSDNIHCVDCKHFKSLGKKSLYGWCKNPVFPKSVRVMIIDYCDKAEKKVSE